MEKLVVTTPNAPTPTGPYSQGLFVPPFFFVAGTLGVEPSTDTLVEGVANQTTKAMENILNVLKEQNLTADNIVKSNLFIKDMNDFPVINEAYKKFFTDKFPVRTCVEVSRMPKDGLIEIECIAMVL